MRINLRDNYLFLSLKFRVREIKISNFCFTPGVPIFPAASRICTAVGSSLPETRELDDNCLSRASPITVDWREQAMEKAGDLKKAAPDCLHKEKKAALYDVLPGRRGRIRPEDIIVYKSVGIGLQDIALAGYACF